MFQLILKFKITPLIYSIKLRFIVTSFRTDLLNKLLHEYLNMFSANKINSTIIFSNKNEKKMTVSISNLMTYKLDSIQSKQGRPGEEITSKNCFFFVFVNISL